MSDNSILTALVIEPNTQLQVPYKYLDTNYSVHRVSSLRQAHHLLRSIPFDLVLISASLQPLHSLRILEILKEQAKDQLPPVVFVIDFTNRINCLPGTTWLGKIAVVDNFANEDQFVGALDRVLSLGL